MVTGYKCDHKDYAAWAECSSDETGGSGRTSGSDGVYPCRVLCSSSWYKQGLGSWFIQQIQPIQVLSSLSLSLICRWSCVTNWVVWLSLSKVLFRCFSGVMLSDFMLKFKHRYCMVSDYAYSKVLIEMVSDNVCNNVIFQILYNWISTLLIANFGTDTGYCIYMLSVTIVTKNIMTSEFVN